MIVALIWVRLIQAVDHSFVSIYSALKDASRATNTDIDVFFSKIISMQEKGLMSNQVVPKIAMINLVTLEEYKIVTYFSS